MLLKNRLRSVYSRTVHGNRGLAPLPSEPRCIPHCRPGGTSGLPGPDTDGEELRPITLYPAGFIGLRLEKCRHEETLSLRAAYETAV